jgi:predicted GIY-YIG superfamily endonuclease
MTPRLLRLRPWLIRALIPANHIGTYMLYGDQGELFYVGRSDTDVQRRLIRHASDRRGEYFTYDIHHTVTSAFDVECALFHIHAETLSNRLHPDKPDFHPVTCAFCPYPSTAIPYRKKAPYGVSRRPHKSQWSSQ